MTTTAKLEQAETLIETLRNSGLINAFYYEEREKQFEQAQTVLTHFREQRLHHFDIFRRVGFRPNENMFSNAIAALLDPKEGHGLGTLPLEKLLDRIAAKVPKPEAVAAIKIQLLQNQSYISVYREKREAKTIPDITIISNDFVIFIENKIRGGQETISDGQAQTERQWQVLECKYKQYGKAVLPIFLTPEGKPAVDKNFIALSVGELVSCLQAAIDAVETNPVHHAINTFLDFYSWE